MAVNTYRGSLIKHLYCVEGREYKYDELPDKFKVSFENADKGSFSSFRQAVLEKIGKDSPGVIKVYPGNIFEGYDLHGNRIL